MYMKQRHLQSTPGPGAYGLERPNDFGRKSTNAAQAWGFCPQFPPSVEFVENSKVPGPKYQIVHPFDGSTQMKGLSWGSSPQVPLTPREIEWNKVPGPGAYTCKSPRNTNATHLGSGSLRPRFEMCYIDPKTPGPAGYDIDRSLTPRHLRDAPSVGISRADSHVVVEMKKKLFAIKATPSVGTYDARTGIEIGRDNPSRRSAHDFTRESGRERPANGDPILEMLKVPSVGAYSPNHGHAVGQAGAAQSHVFARAIRNSIVTGY